MATDSIGIKSADGLDFDAYVARPKTAGPHSVVVVIQEIFGINKFVRSIADMLAEQGYIAVAPDLFHRQEKGVQLDANVEADWKRAFDFYQGFDENKGVADIGDTVKVARKLDGANGKVGTVGFCLGGRLAFLMSTRGDADCNVGYYGVGIDKNLDEPVKHPVMLHIAELDDYCNHEAQAKINAAYANNDKVAVHIYPGTDHAFARVGGQHYDKDAAELAHKRTLEFFKKHIG